MGRHAHRGLGRRALGVGLASGAVCWGLGERIVHARPPIPELPLRLVVAVEGDEPVVGRAWLDEQIAEARRLMKPHGVRVDRWARDALPAEHARLENALDRDALHRFIAPDVINVFVVASLRDVDDPSRMRMGVRWRLRRDLRKDYVIVSARAMPTTLCHELGHYFGNGHSGVVDNVMSYRREDPDKLAFDERQGAKMRAVARRLLATKKLRSVEWLKERAKRSGDTDGA